MIEFAVVGASLCLYAVSTAFAVQWSIVACRRWTWLAAAAALGAMAAARGLVMYSLFQGAAVNLALEAVMLVIAVLAIAGIGALRPLVLNLRWRRTLRLNGFLERRVEKRTAEWRSANRRLQQEIAERATDERRLKAQYAVTATLAESASLEEASPKILQGLCQRLGWEVGELWRLDADEENIELVDIWTSGKIPRDEFEAATRGYRYRPAVGLAGRVWAHRRPEWTPDLASDQRCPRSRAADWVGLHAACAFPILLEQELLGVFVFLSGEIQPPDTDLMAMMASLGSQIGQFIERREAEEALRESERAMSTLVANLPGMAYRCQNEPTWPMGFVSQGSMDLLGYEPEQLTRGEVAFGDLIHPEDRDGVWRRVQAAVQRRTPFQVSYRVRTAAGQWRWLWEQGAGVYGDDERPLALEGFMTDITQRKELEEQCRQTQKMEAVGRLAGGVAHDFNNLLTVINGYADLLQEQLDFDDCRRETVQEIIEAGERAAGLTRQLLTFSRKETQTLVVMDLGAAVNNVGRMLRRLIGEDIELTIRSSSAGKVLADPGQIEQVIVNLAVNARDAMPQGGSLRIEASEASLDEAHAQSQEGVEPGRYVVLTVADTGCGMDEATRARVFEPFFTTKQPGAGTGMGLSMVFGLVQQWGGWIGVDSEPGRGARFKVYLPRIESKGEPAKEEEAEAPPEMSGRETVLVVEDEPAVRLLAKKALEKQGYTVLEASSGREAMEVSERHAGPVHLLLTDAVMPEMDGPETAERLAMARPGMEVLYMSGHAEGALSRHGVPASGAELVPKPFTAAALAQRVRASLDKAQEPAFA